MVLCDRSEIQKTVHLQIQFQLKHQNGKKYDLSDLASVAGIRQTAWNISPGIFTKNRAAVPLAHMPWESSEENCQTQQPDQWFTTPMIRKASQNTKSSG